MTDAEIRRHVADWVSDILGCEGLGRLANLRLDATWGKDWPGYLRAGNTLMLTEGDLTNIDLIPVKGLDKPGENEDFRSRLA